MSQSIHLRVKNQVQQTLDRLLAEQKAQPTVGNKQNEIVIRRSPFIEEA